ncbi:hypothetical protein Sfum_1342 [Syntrophobacter fumaroxidans MPOB]|uniref:Uncharacterized protein n=2 Tax=Syntrophobacter TaxID=29526 RepID=A0LHY1_SYNFM|nr:hypothetical protein Sfum_1342 [Syntrophobacter fumaroxidans MPOB]
MSGYDSWEIRMAWRIARQVRGCPPDSRLFSETADPHLSEHVAICDFCSELRRRGSPVGGADEMTRHLMPQDERARSEERCREGQVWTLRESLAGWGPGKLYYQPPLVLVIGLETGVGGAVRVAQVYDDPRLMGPGDVLIGDGLFAEAWNTYTLRTSDLERLIRVVPENILSEVLQLESAEVEPLEEHSPTAAFRRLEIRVGAYFSIQAVAELMGRLDPSPTRLLLDTFPEPERILQQVRRKKPGIAWPEGELSTLKRLAFARFPADEAPLAASGSQKTVPVNILEIFPLEYGVNFRASIATISVWREHASGFLAGGRILGALLGEADVLACLELPDGSVLDAEESLVSPRDGYFRAFFPDVDPEMARNGRLVLLVCTA